MKKNQFIVLISFILLSGFLSCKKDMLKPKGTASLNIINAAASVPSAAINLYSNGIPYPQNNTFINYQTKLEIGLPSGSSPLNLISNQDTTHYIYHGNVDLAYGSIYSLYIEGAPGKVETLLLKDNIPAYRDSTAGARFINLSPDSHTLNITLQGGSGNDFSNISYKQATSFKTYAAVSNIINNGGYTFNVTDASGKVLTTFNWMPSTFHANTLVISGQVSDGSISVFAVNNY